MGYIVAVWTGRYCIASAYIKTNEIVGGKNQWRQQDILWRNYKTVAMIIEGSFTVI